MVAPAIPLTPTQDTQPDYNPDDLKNQPANDDGHDSSKSAESVCPKQFKTKKSREELGTYLADVCRAAERQRQTYEPRWDRLHSLYNGVPPGRSYAPYSGCADEHFNVIQPRLDALAGIVVGTVTSKEPFCRAYLWEHDDQIIDRELETRVFRAVEMAKYSQTMKRAAICAGWSNAGHTYVEYNGGEISIKHKHPTEVLIYPSTVETAAEAEMYAVRVWRVKSQIDDLVSSGYYFKGIDIAPTQGPSEVIVQNLPETHLTPAVSPRSELDPEGLWKCYFKKDGKSFGATLHKDSSTVLRVWEYPYSTPCLQKYSYKVSSEDSYWTSGSVANDMQGYQLTVNELANMAVDGLRASAFSTLAVPSPIGNDSMDTKIGPGEVAPVSGLDRAVSFLSNINLAPIQGFINMYLGQCDTAARISPLSAASQLRPNTTATEASGVMQGQSESRDDYIETWSLGVEQVFEHVHELLSYHTDWGPLPGVEECKWAAHSTSPAASPEATIQMLMQVLQVAGVPGSDVDVHQLVTIILQCMERMGVTAAQDIQHEPQQPHPGGQPAPAGEPPQMQPSGMGGSPQGDPSQVLASLLGQ